MRKFHYFYPRPPRGGRQCFMVQALAAIQFLSTPSARRATSSGALPGPALKISIHALREEGDKTVYKWIVNAEISIHALREEGDGAGTANIGYGFYFYPRPPRGGRPMPSPALILPGVFLSTPSARRATFTISRATTFILISIHALREEGDPWITPRPRRRCISIHALREEGDEKLLDCKIPIQHFYPRPPRGGRPPHSFVLVARRVFLSTPSARRATFSRYSVHGFFKFLSTPSARRATYHLHDLLTEYHKFLSTPSARRATFAQLIISAAQTNFYPRPPRGGRPPRR